MPFKNVIHVKDKFHVRDNQPTKVNYASSRIKIYKLINFELHKVFLIYLFNKFMQNLLCEEYSFSVRTQSFDRERVQTPKETIIFNFVYFSSFCLARF
jgi:hypothetical protein